MDLKFVLAGVILVLLVENSQGIIRRCFVCRSRGDLGTCKDPFKLNGTETQTVRGVQAVPCASGWCGKILEGRTSLQEDGYGEATQRLCLQRSPSDNEERCAYTVYGYRKVYMCFCIGDLCNDSARSVVNFNLILANLAILGGFYLKMTLF